MREKDKDWSREREVISVVFVVGCLEGEESSLTDEEREDFGGQFLSIE